MGKKVKTKFYLLVEAVPHGLACFGKKTCKNNALFPLTNSGHGLWISAKSNSVSSGK